MATNRTHEVTLSNDDIMRIARALDAHRDAHASTGNSELISESKKIDNLRQWLVGIVQS